MDRELICIDTSVLIDYFRRQDKRKTFFFKLSKDHDFAVSVMTKLEIFCGATEEQQEFWQQVFHRVHIFPLGEEEIDEATEIIKILRLSLRAQRSTPPSLRLGLLVLKKPISRFGGRPLRPRLIDRRLRLSGSIGTD
jgi:predicted nucleic acid-binding protein